MSVTKLSSSSSPKIPNRLGNLLSGYWGLQAWSLGREGIDVSESTAAVALTVAALEVVESSTAAAGTDDSSVEGELVAQASTSSTCLDVT